jgi:uncharacterized protein YbbK (DUF523 family)
VALCSACLLGLACRYDAAEKRAPKVASALAGLQVVPVCPEVAGGLGVPRPKVELKGGDGSAVLDGRARAEDETGRDVSAQFALGAALALEAARRYGASVAVLKEGSPSCGVHRVCVDGTIAPGQGIAASALSRAGLILVSDEDLPE